MGSAALQAAPVINLQAEGVRHQVPAIKGVTFEGGRVFFPSVNCAKSNSKVESRLGGCFEMALEGGSWAVSGTTQHNL